MSQSAPCLALENVSRDFGGLRAVGNVSLTIAPGERHVLIGPNGAGKTTLFHLISGELKASEGKIILFGEDVTGLAPFRRAARGIARTFQITNLFPNLTVMENVLLACEALEPRKFSMLRPLSSYGDLNEKAAKLLQDFGLWDLRGESARNISYGDQRKVEVALSVAGKPKLLLLDEPMAGLSTGESESMQRLLHQLDPAITVLLIEHDMDMAFAFAQRITVHVPGAGAHLGTEGRSARQSRVQEIYLGVHAGWRMSARQHSHAPLKSVALQHTEARFFAGSE